MAKTVKSQSALTLGLVIVTALTGCVVIAGQQVEYALSPPVECPAHAPAESSDTALRPRTLPSEETFSHEGVSGTINIPAVAGPQLESYEKLRADVGKPPVQYLSVTVQNQSKDSVVTLPEAVMFLVDGRTQRFEHVSVLLREWGGSNLNYTTASPADLEQVNFSNRLITESSHQLAPGQVRTIFLTSKKESKPHTGVALRFNCETDLVHVSASP